ncbi:lipase family protein [Corynebacterium sphenisci]|uniref:lipase family protein n=1 Tax=Corynebacterium sphenisci TaxID=191493 RepID=UPI0026DED02A|nr:lipase family protein [Corynebacterium sphenisci]MDO5730324.1 lipase family protein [Corynebacterium sphenisci]
MSAPHRILAALAALAAAALLAAAAPAAAAPTPPGPDALPGLGTLPGMGAPPGAGDGRPGSAGLPLPAGSAGAPGSSGPGTAAPDPFYDEIPAELGAPGTVLKTQPAQHLLAMTGVDWPGEATRVMYTSTRQTGERTGVTGVVIEPTTAWAGPGPRPTVVIAPGTQGVGDQCAPSRGRGFAVDLAEGPSLALNYELPKMYAFAAKGIRVVLTDYIGLGTPGMHTYGHAEDQAHAVLDGLRAGLALAGADPSDPVGITGYSQGGGAAAAAAEHAASYAPELNLRATYAGAVPARIGELLEYLDGTGLVGAIGFGLNAFGVYASPGFAERMDARLNEEGRRFVAETAHQCTLDILANWGLRETREFTVDGRSFAELVEDEPELAAIIERQSLGAATPARPIMIEASPNDDAVEFGQARDLARRYCAGGAHLAFFVDRTPPLLPGTSLNHVVPMELNIPKAVEYLESAFRGEALADDCGAF